MKNNLALLALSLATLAAQSAYAGIGDWVVNEKKELEQSAMAAPQMLVFGDPKWKSYEVECEAKKLRGDEGFILAVHMKDLRNAFWWNIGGYGNRMHGVERIIDGGRRGPEYTQLAEFKPIQTEKWYRLRLRVQCNHYEGWIDDEKVFDCTLDLDENPEGKAGIGTWNTMAIFRNIVVRDDDGKVIFEGTPDPATSQPEP